MKKKLLLLAMSISILALAAGCGKKNPAEDLDSETGKPNTEEGTEEGTEAPTKGEYVVSDYIKLGQYKGVEVKVEQLEVTDEDIENAIKEDLESNATEKEVTDRAVKNGDIVNIDYEGLKDGVAFDGGTAQGTDLTIGAGQFIPGFEEGLIGANVGDKLALDITFPEDYKSKELAGQPVVFNVTINAIKEEVTPELTEDYVKEFTDYDTVDAYKEGMRKSLEAKNVEEMKSAKTNNVFSAILENSEISSYPQTLIDYYAYEMKNYYMQYSAMFGMEFADFLASSGITEEDFNKEAQTYGENRASQELIIKAIIEAEKIKLSDKEYKEGIAKIVTDYEYESEEELLKTVPEDQIKESLLWEKVLNYVTDQAVEI